MYICLTIVHLFDNNNLEDFQCLKKYFQQNLLYCLEKFKFEYCWKIK